MTVLFSGSYQNKDQYYQELEPTPPRRDPPNQAKQNTEHKKLEELDRWACTDRDYHSDDGSAQNILYMRWPDRISNATHRYENQSDLWFDRLVYIHHEGRYDYVIYNYTSYPLPADRKPKGKPMKDLSVTVNGIIFDDDRILTSYNPFRRIIRFAFKRHFTHVCVLYERSMKIKYDDSTVRFRTRAYQIACARQVVPLKESTDVPPNLWHGRVNKAAYIRQHSPLHDLLVIRTHGFIINMTKDNYDFDHFLNQREMYYHGPQKTILAKKNDIMAADFKFAMTGHIFGANDKRKVRRDTYVGYFNGSDHALADCDEWIPREWGMFICVLNKRRLPRLASGAALYSRKLLFGIGSFTLYKGNSSIIVFTDVRPYESLINDSENGPCTTNDQFGKPRSTF